MSSPEVARVYVGSFWQEPLHTLDNAELFEQEERDLMRDLAILPRQSAVRKINEVSRSCILLVSQACKMTNKLMFSIIDSLSSAFAR